MIKNYNDFTWWLNLSQSTTIGDKDFVIAKNVFYNNARQLQTRRWFRTFGNQIWSSPISSYFFYQRDDNQLRNAICVAGSSMYRLDPSTLTWSQIASNLIEFETISTRLWRRTRRDFCVYKNIVYMTDWVNPYCTYDSAFSALLATAETATVDSTTNIFTKSAHWLINGDEIRFTTTWTMPWGVTAYQVYYIVDKTINEFKVSTTYWWSAVDVTTNWTGTLSYQKLSQPRYRYIQYLIDRIFGAWEDRNPITLYYTNAAPAWWNTIDTNAVVVGWDESGIINGLSEYSQSVLTFKDNKVYVVDVTYNKADAIDTQTGWYSDRTISNVANWLVYFNERWIDTLQSRDGVSWVWAIESQTLSDKIRDIVKGLQPKSYNSSTARYIKSLNNYYRSFDLDGDDIPDTHFVYNSLVGSWTQYTLPNIFDYWYYIDDNGNKQFLFASASGGQMYEFEYGYDDAGVPIDAEIQTKNFDFNDPAQLKTFDFVDIVWRKQEEWEIEISVIVDDEAVWWTTVTDAHINTNYSPLSLWVSALWVEPIGASTEEEWIKLYPYTIRVPFYARWSTISVNLKSTWVQRIFEKMRISVNGEPVQVIDFSNIW